MAKKGMKRPERTHVKPRNETPPVPQIKSGSKLKGRSGDTRPIPSDIYPVIDTDLGRDNVENDIPAADLSELQ